MDIKTLIEQHTEGVAEAIAEDIKGRKVETTNVSVSVRQRVAQIRPRGSSAHGVAGDRRMKARDVASLLLWTILMAVIAVVGTVQELSAQANKVQPPDVCHTTDQPHCLWVEGTSHWQE